MIARRIPGPLCAALAALLSVASAARAESTLGDRPPTATKIGPKEAAPAAVETPAAPDAAAPPGKPSPLEPVREAQRRFALAVSLYEEGDLKGALAEFRRAHQIFPSYKVLYNLGTVSRELFDWAAALTYYREYLVEGGTAIAPERRLQIERQVVDLAQRVGRLDVVVKDGPADVVLDEQPVPSRQGALLVNPGKRRLKVSWAGRPPVIKVVEVVSGDQNRVVVERPNTVLKGTKLAARSADLTASAPPPSPPRTRSRAAAWWTWGATAVLGGGALGLGLTARQSSQMLATERTRYPANRDNLADLSDRTRKLALVADVLTATTVVMAAVATYFTFTGPARVDPDGVALAWKF
jgi:hypothetical protein